MNPKEQGVFVVSLDFELYWGMHDKKKLSQYSRHLDGVPEAVRGILDLFQEYEIHATWATVGFLFLRDFNELKQKTPESPADYKDISLRPFNYVIKNEELEPRYHFAPHLIDLIKGFDNQEIGTHTFSHYYCLEKGQNSETFRQDLCAAVEIGRERDLEMRSLVFPRNQFNPLYLPILNELGIKCYRGNQSGFLYKALEQKDESKFVRVCRLLDAYLNVTGYHTYDLADLTQSKPYNIPSSRFLRPYSSILKILEKLRLQRIKASMTHAAKYGRLFHLWWHPHNFGLNTRENLTFLKKILEHFKILQQETGMRSLNMGEMSEFLESGGQIWKN